MPEFVHLRHKPPHPLVRPRELIVACPPLRSNVNLSRIVRTASCCGVQHMIVCGRPKIDPEIARDGALQVRLEVHRTLAPVLRDLKKQGYQLVGLEQTTNSESLHQFAFERRTVLIPGHEREGLDEEILQLVDRVAEIPVYGLPFSLNIASSVDMALYEYCRQFPQG